MADEEKVPAEESEQEPLKISRRDFLVGAGAGVVVTGAAAAGLSALRKPEVVEVPVEVIREVPVTVTTPGETVVVPGASTEGLPPSMRAVNVNIDGKTHSLVVDVRESLWETMTRRLGLGGAINLGCDRAQCGACAVVVDGLAVNGCTVLTARLGRGQQITTVAGLATGSTEADLHPVQKAFWDESGYQCGICTRGFIMAAYALLSHNPNPTEDEIREGLAGNICRCAEYPKVYDAVEKAAEMMRSAA
jgi:aerobic carbon-monoxide dehydrogenase small subunit